MMRVVCTSFVALALFAASSADAQEPTAPSARRRDEGLSIALRSGVAMPVGQVYQASGAISDTVAGYVPLRLDAGYRFGQRFYLGAVGQWAALLPSACTSGMQCSGDDVRVGIMLAYHPFAFARMDPWVGVGVGYEFFSMTRSADGLSTSMSARGFELADVEVGLPFRLSRHVEMGPTLSTSIAYFSRVTVNGVDAQDFDSSVHAWVLAGLEGRWEQ